MSNPDAMSVLRKCAHCRSTDDTVGWSVVMNCYICDSCYTDYNDRLEDERRENQSPSSAPSTR